MNHYTQLLEYLKELAESHELVNTVTHGDPDKIDLEKSNIFPLVHLNIGEAQFGNGKTLIFPITIECLTERDFNKEVINDKFWKQDNEVDNHNETLAIINFMWTSIYRDFNDSNFTTSDNATAEKIGFAKGNVLDGWSIPFNIEVPNTELCIGFPTPIETEILTISIEGDGETSPAPGSYQKENGSTVQLLAAENSGSEFVEWIINTVSYTDRVVNLLINGDNSAKAYFQKLITGYYQDVLKGGVNDIYQKNGLWYARNVGVALTDADLQYTNTQVLTLDGVSAYVATGYSVDTDSIKIKFNIALLNPDPSSILLSAQSSTNGFSIRYSSNQYVLYLKQGDGSQEVIIIGDVDLLDNKDVEINITPTYASITNSTDNVLLGELDNLDNDIIEPARTLTIGTSANPINCTISLFEVENVLSYNFQDTKGTNIKDRFENYDGTLINPVLSEPWENRSEFVLPALLYYGGEIYEDNLHIGDPEYYLYVIKGINGFLNPTITGYTNIGQYDGLTGFWNTRNKVKQPLGDMTLNQVTQDYGLPFYGISESDPKEASFEEIIAIDLGLIPPEKFRFSISANSIINMQTESI